jgi:hypothetical protein
MKTLTSSSSLIYRFEVEIPDCPCGGDEFMREAERVTDKERRPLRTAGPQKQKISKQVLCQQINQENDWLAGVLFKKRLDSFSRVNFFI